MGRVTGPGPHSHLILVAMRDEMCIRDRCVAGPCRGQSMQRVEVVVRDGQVRQADD